MAPTGSDTNAADPSAMTADRRDFYRISDRVGLEIRRDLPADSVPDDLFDGNHLGALRTEFRRLDQDIRFQLATLAERDRLLSALIKSLNGKLDTLERIIAFEQNPLQPQDWQEVTLSEGGLSFHTTDANYQSGEHIGLKLTLPPELYQPVAIARVRAVEQGDNSVSRVHTEFTNIPDHDRQQIARHVLRWQARQRQNG